MPGGESEYTLVKEEHYEKILGWHIGVTVRAICKDQYRVRPLGWRKSYLLVDATAGTGILESGIAGSPIIAISQLSDVEIDWEVYLIEQDKDAFAVLDMTVDHPNVQKRFASYQDVFRQLTPNGKQLGLLYIDPYGAPDFGAIVQFASMFPRMEILLSYNSTGTKRAGKNDTRADEWIRRIGKPYWLVRKPYTAWRWSFLLGSNYVGFNKPYRKIEIEPVTSESGKHWMELLSYTDEERQGKVQPPLTGLMPIT